MSEENGSNENEEKEDGAVENAIAVSGMYQDWFLDYASYVILERAVPTIEDGLKPVQTRIMHSMFELEDVQARVPSLHEQSRSIFLRKAYATRLYHDCQWHQTEACLGAVNIKALSTMPLLPFSEI